MNILEKFRSITTFIFDVDGVLTDGSLLAMPDGDLLRTFHAKDGLALNLAVQAGYNVCIITGGKSPSVIKRLSGLGLSAIFSGVGHDKVPTYQKYMETHDLDPETVLYMGDDLPDIGVLRLVGLPCCPADAVAEVVEVSQYVSPLAGGKGAVRDVIEKVMKLQGKWLQYSTSYKQ